MTAHDDYQRQSRDLIDQSKLLMRRAKKANARSIERSERTHHTWRQVTVGRVCEVCLLTQANGEFEEDPLPGCQGLVAGTHTTPRAQN